MCNSIKGRCHRSALSGFIRSVVLCCKFSQLPVRQLLYRCAAGLACVFILAYRSWLRICMHQGAWIYCTDWCLIRYTSGGLLLGVPGCSQDRPPWSCTPGTCPLRALLISALRFLRAPWQHLPHPFHHFNRHIPPSLEECWVWPAES